jgi:hypothetical protein
LIKKKIVALLFTTTIGIIIFSDIAYTNNNGRAGNTGSPGENACNQCHSTNALNSGGGSVSISSPNMPGWLYFPGTTYTIEVKVKKTGLGKFGFGFEALLASGANGGLIQTANSPNAKILSANVGGNSRTNAVHKQPNHLGQDSLTFTFEWIAPTAGSGNVTFYAAGNASNNANNSSGDFIYTANQIVTEALTTNIDSEIKKNNVTVFPNPTSKFISLTMPESLTEANTLVQIYDIKGQLAYLENLLISTSGGTFSLDLEFLDEGVYFIHLQNGKWQHNQKIIVNK